MTAAAFLRNKATIKRAKKPATNVTVVAQKTTPKMPAPMGGWRTLSVKEEAIIAMIVDNPKLTAREYGDRLGYIAPLVNDCIKFTQQGRALAEGGLIALPARGMPDWGRLVLNQSGLVRRKRESQFQIIQFNRLIKGANRATLVEIMNLFREMDTRTSPRLLTNLYNKAATTLIEIGKARAADQKRIDAVAEAVA